MSKIDYKKIADEILTLNEIENIYLPSSLSLTDANEITKEFYKDFFNQRRNNEIEKLDSNIIFRRNTLFEDYNGRCKNGTKNSLIILPSKNDIKLAISMTHEKAHAYQNNEQINEIIPSFFEMLHAVRLNKEYTGILQDNLNYKIKEAKKAAKNYTMLCSNYSDDKLNNLTNYMFQFLLSLTLVDSYLKYENKDEITILLDNILFEDGDYKKISETIYIDEDFIINEKINNLRNA